MLPVLDGHQHAVAVVHPVGAVPGTGFEGRGLLGKRTQWPCHLLFEGHHAAGQRASGSIQQVHISMRHALASETVEGGSAIEHPAIGFLAGEGDTNLTPCMATRSGTMV